MIATVDSDKGLVNGMPGEYPLYTGGTPGAYAT